MPHCSICDSWLFRRICGTNQSCHPLECRCCRPEPKGRILLLLCRRLSLRPYHRGSASPARQRLTTLVYSAPVEFPAKKETLGARRGGPLPNVTEGVATAPETPFSGTFSQSPGMLSRQNLKDDVLTIVSLAFPQCFCFFSR